jgi:hypothetical protein
MGIADFNQDGLRQMETQILERAVAKIESEIWAELQKIAPDQRRSIEVAGLEAMRNSIAQRVRCLTTGEDCGATIAGMEIGWF